MDPKRRFIVTRADGTSGRIERALYAALQRTFARSHPIWDMPAFHVERLAKALVSELHRLSAKKKRGTRRQRELADAANALRRLRAKNDVKSFNLRDVAKESKIPYSRLRKLGLRNIRASAR